LLAGIQLDTDFLSRGVGKLDLEAHYRLFFLGNGELARELVRTFLGTDQLVPLGHALAGCLTRDGALVTEVSGDCPAELLSVLADFLLRLRDVTFVTVVAESEGGYHVSARNRDRSVNAGAIIARAIGEAGSGGGHPHMAGGVFRPGGYPGAEAFLRKIIDEITAYRSKNETDGEAN
jgi:nanoRNase/pAp phosphatase (c-di-AMP/oligoRNAs hydrolase)